MAQYTTPISLTLAQRQYTVEFPEFFQKDGVTYKFKDWEDGPQNRIRQVNLLSDVTIRPNYEEVTETSYPPADSLEGTATIGELAPTLTLTPLAVTALKGETEVFTGKLSDSEGNGIAGKTIHFFVEDVDTGIAAITDANGDFAFDYTWPIVGTFKYKAKYLGD